MNMPKRASVHHCSRASFWAAVSDGSCGSGTIGGAEHADTQRQHHRGQAGTHGSSSLQCKVQSAKCRMRTARVYSLWRSECETDGRDATAGHAPGGMQWAGCDPT